MTKMHFEAAAAQVRRYDDRAVAAIVARAFADLFRSYNPRFDADRFYAACLITAEQIASAA